MKLIRMHVDNFGCLHDFDYEFDEGVNVLLQDNGWGKTTMADFLKAMLYGFDTRRSKDITENARRRYLPWQGGKYGGSLDFEAAGVNYRVFRNFGETPRFDTTKILNMDTKTTARIDPNKIGQTLFGLDVNAFQRSVFINQNGLAIDGASSSIHTRLNSLVSQANDLAAYDGAITDLTQQIKIYEKTGARGKLGDISREITAKEKERDRLEHEIAEQDEARERISRIDMLLAALSTDLGKKKKRLEVISGEAKKREASVKMLADLNAQIEALQQKLDTIQSDLGGSIPLGEEINEAKKQEAAARIINDRLKELVDDYSRLTLEAQSLLEKYHGALPQDAQLDRLQSLYSELQSLSSGNEESADIEKVPDEYRLIDAASAKIAGYPDMLKDLIERQAEIETLTRTIDITASKIEAESKSWEEKKEGYLTRKAELEHCQADLEAASAGRPEVTRPAIERLSALQKLQHTAEVQRREVEARKLSDKEKALIANAPQNLPDEAEAQKMLEKLRIAKQLEASLQGLEARLSGEESKEASLRAALTQYNAIPDTITTPSEPKKSVGGVMIGGGVAVLILGIVLGIIINPILFALAAVGLALSVLGVSANRQYAARMQIYKTEKAAAQQRQEARTKKTELDAQLREEQETLSGLREQIRSTASTAEQYRAEVSVWLARYAPTTEPSEQAVQAELDRIVQIKALRKKAKEAEEAARALSETEKYIQSEKEQLEASFPWLHGQHPETQADALRAMETEYQIKLAGKQRAEKELTDFLTTEQLTEDLLAGADSPALSHIREEQDRVEKALEGELQNAEIILNLIGLSINRENAKACIRQAEQAFNVYLNYKARTGERTQRQNAHNRKLEELQNRLETEVTSIIGGIAEDRPISERIALARQDSATSKMIKQKLSEIESEQTRLEARQYQAEQIINAFLEKHAPSLPRKDALTEIQTLAGEYSELSAALKQLQKQKESIKPKEHMQTDGEEEAVLRTEIMNAEKRRDELLVEYTQKSDAIRQADRALETYPDVVQEIRQLNEQKQQAQASLVTLKRAIQLITRAKENLAARYLGKVENLFNRYMQIWLQSEAVRGILDTDFKITIEEDGKVHVPEGYSTGTSDLIDFCMRLALVDTLFEKEQPFLILDDPFVNLDEDRLEKAQELLGVMSTNKQIVYFVCHPIRAVEAKGNSASMDEFRRLTAATRQDIETRKSITASRAATPGKTPKERYHIPANAAPLAIQPMRKNYTITNSIFSMSFQPNPAGLAQDHSYELFFIDKPGHVLNERQLLEVRNGKLSTERIQFSLNTRDDSGDEYELMIREAGQDDYNVVARIPFKAKLAFAGTFSFD